MSTMMIMRSVMVMTTKLIMMMTVTTMAMMMMTMMVMMMTIITMTRMMMTKTLFREKNSKAVASAGAWNAQRLPHSYTGVVIINMNTDTGIFVIIATHPHRCLRHHCHQHEQHEHHHHQNEQHKHDHHNEHHQSTTLSVKQPSPSPSPLPTSLYSSNEELRIHRHIKSSTPSP